MVMVMVMVMVIVNSNNNNNNNNKFYTIQLVSPLRLTNLRVSKKRYGIRCFGCMHSHTHMRVGFTSMEPLM